MLLFETERLIVRRFIPDDAESFFLLNSNPDVLKYIRPVKNRDECDAFLLENIHLYLAGSVIGRYAVIEKQNCHIIGTFSFLYLAGESDLHIGYALLPHAWRKGYATELVKQGVLHFFSKTCKQELFAITDTENVQSQLVLIKCGFFSKAQKQEYGRIVELFCIYSSI
jgi:RimJ/RimL family protein N-acetyltransferase